MFATEVEIYVGLCILSSLTFLSSSLLLPSSPPPHVSFFSLGVPPLYLSSFSFFSFPSCILVVSFDSFLSILLFIGFYYDIVLFPSLLHIIFSIFFSNSLQQRIQFMDKKEKNVIIIKHNPDKHFLFLLSCFLSFSYIFFSLSCQFCLPITSLLYHIFSLQHT